MRDNASRSGGYIMRCFNGLPTATKQLTYSWASSAWTDVGKRESEHRFLVGGVHGSAECTTVLQRLFHVGGVKDLKLGVYFLRTWPVSVSIRHLIPPKYKCTVQYIHTSHVKYDSQPKLPFIMSSQNSPQHRGALIVVEGLDRAGKTSQCQLLLEALRQQGHQVKYIKFPGDILPYLRLPRCG